MRAHVKLFAHAHGQTYTKAVRSAAAMSALPKIIAVATTVLAGALPAAAQQSARDEAVLKQVAPDLHFFYEFTGSNAVVLTTNDGVLVIDTRTHPRHGQELIDPIPTTTANPINQLINTH